VEPLQVRATQGILTPCLVLEWQPDPRTGWQVLTFLDR
jgi:hypothetical protein